MQAWIHKLLSLLNAFHYVSLRIVLGWHYKLNYMPQVFMFFLLVIFYKTGESERLCRRCLALKPSGRVDCVSVSGQWVPLVLRNNSVTALRLYQHHSSVPRRPSFPPSVCRPWPSLGWGNSQIPAWKWSRPRVKLGRLHKNPQAHS